MDKWNMWNHMWKHMWKQRMNMSPTSLGVEAAWWRESSRTDLNQENNVQCYLKEVRCKYKSSECQLYQGQI